MRIVTLEEMKLYKEQVKLLELKKSITKNLKVIYVVNSRLDRA